MGKSSHHITHRKPKRARTREQPIAQARSFGVTHQHLIQHNQWEVIWEAFPEALLAYNHRQDIVRINAAARKLFEVDSETQCQGRNYQPFLTSYIRSDEQPPCASREQWLMNLARAYETGTCSPAQTLLLHLPSGRTILVTVRSFPVGARGRDPEETISAFHSWPEIFHLQRVYEAMLDLLAAIAQIPEQMDRVLPEETFLLSPPVLFVAQQVVDVVRSVLECLRVNMLAFGRRTGHLYFVAGSGLTPEQEQYWRRDIGGGFHPAALLDDAAFARLGANQKVVLANDQLHTIERLGKQLPFPASLHPVSPGSEMLLFLPLFLEQQLVGSLVVVKASSEGAYTPEEIALVKAVTAQTMLVN